MEYSQPSFYHFNEDSIKLVNFVYCDFFKRGYEKSKTVDVLDLCCGCGVIGIEFYQKLKKVDRDINKLHFLEINSIYKDHIFKNQKIINDLNVEVKTFIKDFRTFDNDEKYDLILSNPPYFLKSKFRPSQDENRNLARLYEMGFFDRFIEFVSSHLMPGGKVIF